jgi:hypothetical protein
MASRILTVRLQPNTPLGNIPVRKITYSNSPLEISEVEYANILESIPEYWHTEKDKLTLFVFFDDNTYFCERQKQVFDYTTRESTEKIYRFDHAPNEEAEKLYKFFIHKYGEFKIQRVDNLYDDIITKIKDMSYLKYSLLDYRDDLLKKSDFVMLFDYPISEEKREQWKIYRQELRDLTKQESWISNHIMDVQIPVSPEPIDQLNTLKESMEGMEAIPPDLLQQMIDTVSSEKIEDIVKKVAQISVKFELMKSISQLRIPFVEIGEITENLELGIDDLKSQYNEFDDIVELSTMPKSWWDAAIGNIDKKIQYINNTLKQFDVDFTIGDILDAIVEKTKTELETHQLLMELEESSDENMEI